jgi:hypothetical protein
VLSHLRPGGLLQALSYAIAVFFLLFPVSLMGKDIIAVETAKESLGGRSGRFIGDGKLYIDRQ